MRIEQISSKNFGIQFNYDLEIINWIKTFPGTSFDGDRKMWIVPLMFGMEITRKMQISPTYISEDIYKSFEELEYKPNHKGFIYKTDLDVNSVIKLTNNEYVVLDGNKYGNHKTDRSQNLIEGSKFETKPYLFVFDEVPPKNEVLKLFTALKVINHKYGFWVSWYQKRFCNFEKGRFGPRYFGFNNREEFYFGIKDIIKYDKDFNNNPIPTISENII